MLFHFSDVQVPAFLAGLDRSVSVWVSNQFLFSGGNGVEVHYIWETFYAKQRTTDVDQYFIFGADPSVFQTLLPCMERHFCKTFSCFLMENSQTGQF